MFSQIFPNLNDKTNSRACCVVIDKIYRNLFILPKQQPKGLQNADQKPHEVKYNKAENKNTKS